MIIVGGTYLEVCGSPRYAGLAGPGLRAAMALSGRPGGVHLHTVAGEGICADIQATCDALRIDLTLYKPPKTYPKPIWFQYSNALMPRLPAVLENEEREKVDLSIMGDSILVLGLLEAKVTVVGHSVVYEPELESSPNLFVGGRSRAKRLSLVLKAKEFRAHLGNRRPADCARTLMNEAGADVLVVRSELGGATIFQGDHPAKEVGPYETKRWHRLGMGNIFSAVFAYHWAHHKTTAEDAARHACIAAAYYNEGGGLPTSSVVKSMYAEAHHLRVPLIPSSARPTIRIEGCNTRYVERQLFEDTIDALRALETGVQMRVPLSGIELAPTLDTSFPALLILSDFADDDAFCEAKRAALAGKHIISFAEYPRCETDDLERTPGVETVNDFVTAIYRSAVAARRVGSKKSS